MEYRFIKIKLKSIWFHARNISYGNNFILRQLLKKYMDFIDLEKYDQASWEVIW